MFQDRRRHPRYPLLLKAVAVSGGERFDVVCANIGPAGAFFTSRQAPQVTGKLTIELRASGMGSAQVEIGALVVRVVPPGSTWPAGFAVRWTIVRCTLGAEPLARMLSEVLKIADVPLSELGAGERGVTLDIEAWLNGVRRPPSQPMDPSAAGRDNSTIIRRVQGNWSPPMVGQAPSSTQRIPLAQVNEPRPQNVVHVQKELPARPVLPQPAPPARQVALPPDPQPRVPTQDSLAHRNPAVPAKPAGMPLQAARPAESFGANAPATSVQAPGAVRATGMPPVQGGARPSGRRSWAAPDFQPRGQNFLDPLGFDNINPDTMPVDGHGTDDTLRPSADDGDLFDAEQSQPVGRRQGTLSGDALGNEGPSQSWPVYALAPGERRPLTRTGGASPGSASEDILSSVRAVPRPPVRDGARQARSTAGPEVIGPHRSSAQTHPGPISSVSGPTPLPGERSSAAIRPSADPRVMRNASVPVTFVRQNQIIPGRIVSIAQQAVAIVTEDAPPELDEPLVVNMPVLVEGTYRTIYLSGKLLQIAVDTEQGRRFVMHIERVEEGKSKGAFKNFLSELQG